MRVRWIGLGLALALGALALWWAPSNPRPSPSPAANPPVPRRGAFYIADTGNHRIVRMDSFEGDGWQAFGTCGGGVGQFRRPTHVTLDRRGRLYIADSGNHRIVRMDDMQGTGWTVLDNDNPRLPRLREPLRLLVHPVTQEIYVADPASNRVLAISDMKATRVRVLEDHWGVIDMPTSLALDRYGRLYVANDESLRLVRIPEPGEPFWEIYDGADIPGPYPGLRGMGCVTVAPEGRIYLADRAGDRIVGLAPDLSPLGTFGTRGSGPHELYDPHDVTVDGQGRLVIADTRNHRLVRIDDLEGTNWRTTGGEGSGEGRFRFPYSCTWSGSLPRALSGDPPPPAAPGRVQGYRPGPQTRDAARIGQALRAEGGKGGRAAKGVLLEERAPSWLEEGTLLVVSDTYNDRVVFLSRRGRRLHFQALEQGPDGIPLREPSGLAVDGQGRLLVTDTENRRLVRMATPEGGGWEVLDGSGGRFHQPSGVAVHRRTGRIFVCDPNEHHVVRVDDMAGNGWTVYSDGGRRFRMPEGVAFDARGRLYVTTTDGDYALFRIDDLEDTRGTGWKRYLGEDLRPLPGFRDLLGVAVDPEGSAYVTDPTNDRVVVVEPGLHRGRPIGTFGLEGRHFFVPLGVALAPDGHLVVVDSGNHRLVAFLPRASRWDRPADWWSLGRRGSGPGEFLGPMFVTFWKPAEALP